VKTSDDFVYGFYSPQNGAESGWPEALSRHSRQQ
jgi:hypothetical protein